MARHPDKAPDFDTIIRRLAPMKRARMVNIFLGDDGNIGISVQRHAESRVITATLKDGQDAYEKLLEVIGPAAGESWADWLGTRAGPEAPAPDDDEDDWKDLI